MLNADTAANAFVVGASDGRAVHVLGNEVRIKISTRDTGGAFTVFEGQTRPLEGPPLHRHPEHDEWWYIVEDEYKFQVDGREIYGRSGDIVFAPRGSVHTFQNVGTATGRTLTTAIPGGLDLFFEELETAAPRGCIPDRAKMVAIFEKYGQELLGPPLAVRSGITASGGD